MNGAMWDPAKYIICVYLEICWNVHSCRGTHLSNTKHRTSAETCNL